MKVFISHAFGGDDELLAGTLKDDLAAAGLDGYMAERTPRYNLPISDKIRQEIDESGWLVAVITKRSHASASVHEEIGYAFGKGVEIALMVEEGVEAAGVFTHGREYKRFRASEFGRASRKMAGFISAFPPSPPRPGVLDGAVREFLEKRRLLDADSPDYAENEHLAGLHSESPGGAKKPAVMFTSCPHTRGMRADVAAPGFGEWVKSIRHLEVQGHRIPVGEHEHRIDIGALRVVQRHPRSALGRDILAYREFRSGGSLEYGTSSLFLGRNSAAEPSLHLCHMVGAFWGFVLYARALCQRLGAEGPVTVSLHIRNSSELALEDRGGEADGPARERTGGRLPGYRAPRTLRRNIRISHTFASAGGMGDVEVADAVKQMAVKVCNAYGEAAPKCYDDNGGFTWNLWDKITPW